MELALTAVYKKVSDGYVAYVVELPGANTEGDTLDEARASLREAVELVIEANRTLAREDASADVIREPLRIATGRSAAISSGTSTSTAASSCGASR